MKILNKILIILVLMTGIFGIFEVKPIYASSLSNDVGGFKANITNNVVKSTSTLRSIAGRFLGFLRIVAALALVIIVGTTGYKYIVLATPDMKKELKKEMLPIILGLIFIFGAVSLAQFILSAVGG
jgi:amino acid transporter